MPLQASTDRKVATRIRVTAKTKTPEIKNAFGLPAHISCPGATDVCRDICYAFRLEKAYTGVQKVLKSNWEQLQACEDDVDKIYDLLESMICTFVADTNKLSAKYDEDIPYAFRIHWDGDFYSESYAEAWSLIIADYSYIDFWAYTRSFCEPVNVVPVLGLVTDKNLTLYLSVDKSNVEHVPAIIEEYPEVKLAFLDTTFEQAKELSEAVIGRKAPKCPEQTGHYPLVVEENNNGACITCGLCIRGTNNVLFSTSKK